MLRLAAHLNNGKERRAAPAPSPQPQPAGNLHPVGSGISETRGGSGGRGLGDRRRTISGSPHFDLGLLHLWSRVVAGAGL